MADEDKTLAPVLVGQSVIAINKYDGVTFDWNLLYRKCGEITDQEWFGSKDNGGIMILTFDSYYTNRPAGRGFQLKVDVVGRRYLLYLSKNM